MRSGDGNAAGHSVKPIMSLGIVALAMIAVAIAEAGLPNPSPVDTLLDSVSADRRDPLGELPFMQSLQSACSQTLMAVAGEDSATLTQLIAAAFSTHSFLPLVKRCLQYESDETFKLALIILSIMPGDQLQPDADRLLDRVFQRASRSGQYSPDLLRIVKRLDPDTRLSSWRASSKAMTSFVRLYTDPNDSDIVQIFAELQRRVPSKELQVVTKAASLSLDPVRWASLYYDAIQALLLASKSVSVSKSHLRAFLSDYAWRTCSLADIVTALWTMSFAVDVRNPIDALLRRYLLRGAFNDEQRWAFVRRAPAAEVPHFVRALLDADRTMRDSGTKVPNLVWSAVAGQLFYCLMESGHKVVVDDRHDALRILSLLAARGVSLGRSQHYLAKVIQRSAHVVADHPQDLILCQFLHTLNQQGDDDAHPMSRIRSLLLWAWPVAKQNDVFVRMVARSPPTIALDLLASIATAPDDIFRKASVPLLEACLPSWRQALWMASPIEPLRAALNRLPPQEPYAALKSAYMDVVAGAGKGASAADPSPESFHLDSAPSSSTSSASSDQAEIEELPSGRETPGRHGKQPKAPEDDDEDAEYVQKERSRFHPAGWKWSPLRIKA